VKVDFETIQKILGEVQVQCLRCGACTLDLAVWKHRKEKDPDSKLPEEVAEALRHFEMAKRLFGGGRK